MLFLLTGQTGLDPGHLALQGGVRRLDFAHALDRAVARTLRRAELLLQGVVCFPKSVVLESIRVYFAFHLRFRCASVADLGVAGSRYLRAHAGNLGCKKRFDRR